MARLASCAGVAREMNAGIKISGEKLLLLGAVAVFILSCVWVRGRQAEIHRLQHWPLLGQPSGPAYRPEKWPPPEATSRDWPSPPTPASGADWHYEVFTPPRI